MEMTLHRALCELKLIDKRIASCVAKINSTAVYKKGGTINGETVEKFSERAKSEYQSFNDLIKRRDLIKKALVKANATTNLTIGGVEMTIAEAIDMKVQINYKSSLLTQLRSQHYQATSTFNTMKEKLNQEAIGMAEKAIGKEGVKTDPETAANIVNSYTASREIILCDPLDSNKLITDLEKEVGDFNAEVDSALSEINGLTKITILD